MHTRTLPPSLHLFLNLLRGFSAQLVLFDHLVSFNHLSLVKILDVIPLASIGVFFFFLLSGFLIAHTLIAHRDDGFRYYLIDRLARIYPPYIGALILVAIVDCVFIKLFPDSYAMHGYHYSFIRWLADAFFIPKLNFHASMSIFGSATQLWTLPIEWWLYISVGMAYHMFYDRIGLMIKWPLLLLAMICPLTFMIKSGISVVWLLGAGCLLFYTRYEPVMDDKRLVVSLLILAALVMFCCAKRYAVVNDPYDFLCDFDIAIVFMILCWLSACLSPAWRGYKLLARFASFTASYSYSLYLTHYTLLAFLTNYRMPPSAQWLLCNAFALGFAAVFEWRHKGLAVYLKSRIPTPSSSVPYSRS